jgi:hypothetical protein
MIRTFTTLLVGVLLAAAGGAWAADPPAGNWKVTILNPDGPETLWLVQFTKADEKWTGSVLAEAEGFPKFTVEGLTVAGERLRFSLKTAQQAFTFDGKLPKEAAKSIKGSIASEGQIVPCELETTALTKLDAFELNKEFLANHPNDPSVFRAGLRILSQAADHKAKPEEVRGWAEKLWKAAEPYGVRWQLEMATRAADSLSQQEGYAAIAVAYAQRAERLLEPKDPAATKKRLLTILAKALDKAGKADDAKQVQARLANLDKELKAEQAKRIAEQAKLEAQEDEEYLKKMPPFKVEPFAGRKDKSERAVLVELFTGAQCPPCVAADLAFDGLAKTYKPTDVVLLQYHVHVPGPDALANLDSMARLQYYEDEVEGTPTFLLNGKAEKGGGGGIKNSSDVYEQFRKLIEPLLEKPAQASLELSAQQRGKKIEVTAQAANIENPGDSIRLRIMLVEEQVRYVGSNGIRFHHHVVRAMPGGDTGLALKQKTTRHSVTVDLDEVRKQLTQYISTVAKKSGAKFPEPEQVLELKKLRLVAFVQNDKTKEVLQAKQVEVDSGGKE